MGERTAYLSNKSCQPICHSNDRPAWLEARKRLGVGASESPGVLGVSPWSSGISVFADKIDPEPPVERDEERLELGRLLEPVILRYYEKQTERKTASDGMLYQSKRWPFLIATLDGLTNLGNEAEAIVEVKNTQDRQGWSNGVPRHVFVQVQHQMAVTGYSYASIAALICGCEFRWCDVQRDDDFIENALVPDVERFWNLVLAGGPPPQVDGSEATTKALARLYPNDTGERIVLSGEFIDLAEHRMTYKSSIKALEESIAEIENRVKLEIGSANATFGVVPNGGEFSWRANKNGVRTLRYKEPREI